MVLSFVMQILKTFVIFAVQSKMDTGWTDGQIIICYVTTDGQKPKVKNVPKIMGKTREMAMD